MGVPGVIILAAILRIGFQFNFMERMQALVVIGGAALLVGVKFVADGRRAYFLVPLLMTVLVGKVIYVRAIVPERDYRESPRAVARAIGRYIPKGAVLFTSLPTDAAFRYYVGAEIRPIRFRQDEMIEAAERFVLFPKNKLAMMLQEKPYQWQVIRRFETSGGEAAYLARSKKEYSAPLARADRAVAR